jgi:hypothetical protein
MITKKTIQDVRTHNEKVGGNWFSKDTMKFWHTRIESTLIREKYFITSEKKWDANGQDSGARVYAVREALPDGHIKTIASYLGTRNEAKDVIRELK